MRGKVLVRSEDHMGIDANVVQSRLSTRETSTLAVATIAASASLIMLQLTVGESHQGASHPWLRLAGILLALFGFVYREMTIYSSDLEENALLRRLQADLPYDHQWWTRAFLFRVFLLFSAASWFVALFAVWSYYLHPSVVVVIMSAILWTVATPALVYMFNKERYGIAATISIIFAMMTMLMVVLWLSLVTNRFVLASVVYVVVASAVLTWTEGKAREKREPRSRSVPQN
jgi:hypothetical protein